MPRLGGAVDLPQVNDPATPASGRQFLYFKSDGLLYTKKSDGTVAAVGGGGGGAAPTNMVTTDTGTLAAPQSITGIKNFGGPTQDSGPSARFGKWGSLQVATNGFYFGQNCYWDGTNWRYINANLTANVAGFGGGHFTTYCSPVGGGAADSIITFTQGLDVLESGQTRVPGGTDGGLYDGDNRVWSASNVPTTVVTTNTAQTVAGVKTWDVASGPITHWRLAGANRMTLTDTGSLRTIGGMHSGDLALDGFSPTAQASSTATDPTFVAYGIRGAASQTADLLALFADPTSTTPVARIGPDGAISSNSAAATSTTTSVSSPLLTLRSSRWSGTASVDEPVTLRALRGSSAVGDVSLETNAGFRAPGLFDSGNRVWSASNVPTTMVTTNTDQAISALKSFNGPGANQGIFLLNDSTAAAPTPIKGLRVRSGAFEITNHAGTAAIFSATDAGAITGPNGVFDGANRVYSDSNPPETLARTVFPAASVPTPAAGQAVEFTTDGKSLDLKAADGTVTRIGPSVGGGGGGTPPPWAGSLHGSIGNGEPEWEQQLLSLWGPSGTTTALTPTNIGVSVGRLVLYRSDFAITVNRIRWYGLAVAQTSFRMSVYNASTGAQVIAPQTVTTTATEGWQSVLLSPAVTLAADTPYWVGISATATGTTAALRSMVAPGLFPPLPATVPASLNPISNNRQRFQFAQVALTNGVFPATLPTLVRASGWTGSVPYFLFDNSTAA